MSKYINQKYFEELNFKLSNLPDISTIYMSPYFMEKACKFYDRETIENIISVIDFIEKNEELNEVLIINRGILIDEMHDRKYFFYVPLKTVPHYLTRIANN